MTAPLRFLTRLMIRPYRRRRKPSKLVAIVVPLSTRDHFLPDEIISLRHLEHHLGKYDKFLVVPDGMNIAREGFRVASFSRKYFGSVAAHNHMLYWPGFYKRFEDYDYVFFYHLDSLAFGDELENWCNRGLDFIGPPWIKCDDSPWVTTPRVGNGGFALLRVESALKVLYNRYRMHSGTYWYDMFTRNGKVVEPIVRVLRKLCRHFSSDSLLARLLSEWDKMRDPAPNSRNSDIFWADKAIQFLPEFKVASLKEGLQFGFEAAPRQCLEMNGGKMPFGCHAWARYDRTFWEPFLLRGSQTVAPPPVLSRD